jgi:hypothetical protein
MRKKIIKDWKRFTESLDSEYGDMMENFEEQLKNMGKEIATEYEEKLSHIEQHFRKGGGVGTDNLFLTAFVKMQTTRITAIVQEDILDARLPEIFTKSLLRELFNSREKNEGYMINVDIKKGLLSWINDFAKGARGVMAEYAKSVTEDEGDLSYVMKKSEEDKPLSKSDIQKQIDDALDKRDFKEVHRLNTLLDSMNESAENLTSTQQKLVEQTSEKIGRIFASIIHLLKKSLPVG